MAYIAQEPILGGLLFDFIKYSGKFNEKTCRHYLKQILLGVHHIHKNGYAHRDLKIENILFDLNYQAKIIDFGFSSPLKGSDDFDEDLVISGTKEFMAPEMLDGKSFQGEATDVFALGCILFIICTGHYPFESALKNDYFY